MTSEQQHHGTDDVGGLESMLDHLAHTERAGAPVDLERSIMDRLQPVLRGEGEPEGGRRGGMGDGTEAVARSLDRLAQFERASAGVGLEGRIATAASLVGQLPDGAEDAPSSLEVRIFEATRQTIASARDGGALRLVGSEHAPAPRPRTKRWMTGAWSAVAAILVIGGGGLLWYANQPGSPGADPVGFDLAINDGIGPASIPEPDLRDAVDVAVGIDLASVDLPDDMFFDFYTIVEATRGGTLTAGYDDDDDFEPSPVPDRDDWCVYCPFADEDADFESHQDEEVVS